MPSERKTGYLSYKIQFYTSFNNKNCFTKIEKKYKLEMKKCTDLDKHKKKEK